MKTTHRVLGLVVALALLGACQRKESDSVVPKAVNGKVRLLGAGAVVMLVAPIADAFHEQHPDVKIEMEPSNSNWGVGAVRNGMTDIAMSTRKPYCMVGRPISWSTRSHATACA